MPITDNNRRLLEENRQSLNQRFFKRQASGAKIESDAWLSHLRTHVLPLVDEVQKTLPERCHGVLNQLYDVSLDLFSVGHFGETTGVLPSALNRLWTQVLPQLATWIARDARRVTGSLSNAVLAIAQARAESATLWLNMLITVGSKAESVEQLLQIAQVAAWVSGLPEYRTAAVDLATRLPVDQLRCLLNISDNIPDSQINSILTRWRSYAWVESEEVCARSNIQQVSACGAFSGFGGPFPYPPRVFTHDQQLFASDGQQVWHVLADRFGQSFHRLGLSASYNSPPINRHQPQIDADGRIQWENETIQLPELSNSTSQAFFSQTLAVTLPNSFHIFLLARPTLDGVTA